jgi:peptidoglycan/LPS O-acetylase OafA/YrhL
MTNAMRAEAAAEVARRVQHERIPELEGLRGVLAWAVVSVHVILASGFVGPSWRGSVPLMELGECAVDLFMLLSGFAIARLLLVERESDRIYIWRRACRIVPAYWIALVCSAALSSCAISNLRHLPPDPVFAGFIQVYQTGAARLWTDGLLHFLLCHGLAPATWLPLEPYTLLGVAWSLSLEWQFYCVMPFALWFAMKNRRGFVVVLVLVVLCTFYSVRITETFSNAFLPAKAAFFFVGALSYVKVIRNENGKAAAKWLAVSCFGFGLLWVLVWWRHPLEPWLTFGGWALLIFAVRFNICRSLRALLDSPPMQLLGRVSYSTYLFHAPVVTVLQFAIWRWIHPASRGALLLWTALTALPAVVFCSVLAWRFIEQPFQRLGKTWPARR